MLTYACTGHCVSSHCTCSLYLEPGKINISLSQSHTAQFCTEWEGHKNKHPKHFQATLVHREEVSFSSYLPAAVYMSEMSWRPCRICQVWCSRSQLEWQTKVWVAAWQRLLLKCEMSVNETEMSEWDLGWWLICQCPDRQQGIKILEEYWRACVMTMTDRTVCTCI